VLDAEELTAMRGRVRDRMEAAAGEILWESAELFAICEEQRP
jgi:hypothetical protein